MAAFCREHAITLFAYGAFLGGLLWGESLDSLHEPRRPELKSPSLQKYNNMIDALGRWTLFRELLAVLKQTADKHRVSMANVGIPAIYWDRARRWPASSSARGSA